MVMATRSVVVGVFSDQTKAQEAIRELRRVGFQEDQIGVAGRQGIESTTGSSPPVGGSTAVGAGVGAVAGAGTGALWALGIAVGAVPAIGPVIAGGLLASVLASAAGTAAVGGLVGALVGLGISENEARYYESEFSAGRTVVTVRANGRSSEAAEILLNHGGYDMSSRSGTGTASRA